MRVIGVFHYAVECTRQGLSRGSLRSNHHSLPPHPTLTPQVNGRQPVGTQQYRGGYTLCIGMLHTSLIMVHAFRNLWQANIKKTNIGKRRKKKGDLIKSNYVRHAIHISCLAFFTFGYYDNRLYVSVI